MGWLREYMNAAQPPVSSFGRLAHAALDHEQWPDAAIKARSLATIFSKLDRGEQLDWLRDRLEVQHVLAELLGRPLADIRHSVGQAPATGGDLRFVRLQDVRFARELDLSRDALPPGLPAEVIDPPAWGCSWWWAGPGAGKSLAGRWLKCRGLAHAVTVSSREELERVPQRGPLFLEFEPAFFDEHTLSEDDFRRLRRNRRPLMVASQEPAPGTWECARVFSPKAVDFLPELVDWVSELLDGSGNFQPDRAEQWVRRVAIPAGAVRTFGDALGLLGMLDEVHPRSLLSKSLDEVGAHFVSRRIREAGDPGAVPSRLVEAAYLRLVECAAKCLADEKRRLSGEYTIDIWTELLSTPEHEDAPNPQWFVSALSGALGHRVSKRDLESAARKMQPSAFSLAQSLCSAQLLTHQFAADQKSEVPALRLGPRWLLTLLDARAAGRLISHSHLEWGAVLLVARDADRVVGALLDAVRRGQFSELFTMLDEFDGSVAESLAAFEAVVIACGLAMLEGHQLPDELLKQLLMHAADSAMVIGDEVLPRTVHVAPTAELFRECFYVSALACFCLVEPFPLAHLDPIRSQNDRLRLFFVQQVRKALEDGCTREERAPRPTRKCPSEAQAVGLLDLLASLYDSIRQSGTTVTAPQPAYLQLAKNWENRSLFLEAEQSCPVSVVIRYAESRGQRLEVTFAKLWELLLEEESPPSHFEPSFRDEFWAALPGELLRKRVQLHLPIEWEKIRPHQFANLLGKSDLRDVPAEAFQHCPLDAAEVALRDAGPRAFPAPALRALLARASNRLVSLLPSFFQQPEQIIYLLENCPPPASATIAAALPNSHELLKSPPALVDAVRRFLRGAVVERHPQYQLCHTALSEIESALWPLRRVP